MEDTFGELDQYMRSIANKYKSFTLFALTIAIAVVVLTTVPIGSTLATTKSFSNRGNNIKAETEDSKPHQSSSNLLSPANSNTTI